MQKPGDQDEAIDQARRRLGKYAVYLPPAMATLLISNQAMARSLGGEPRGPKDPKGPKGPKGPGGWWRRLVRRGRDDRRGRRHA
jgi:hypothetical protein